MVSNNNATLKAACLYEDICVGKFSEDLVEIVGNVLIDEYTVEGFKNAFIKCINLDKISIDDKSKLSGSFGNQYSFGTTIKSYLDLIREL